MEPILSQKVLFFFKGGREYVHGTTIFQRFIKALPAGLINDAGMVEVVNFKVLKEVFCNGTIKLYLGPRSSNDDSAATMLLKIDTQQYYLTLQLDPSSPVNQNRNGNEQSLVPKDPELIGPFTGIGTIQNANNNFLLMEGLVEVNKRLHILTTSAQNAAPPQVRWVFLQNYRLIPAGVELGHRINAKFEHRGSREMQGRFYTYNKLVDGLPGDPPPATFCFSCHTEE